VPWIRTQWIH